jgi:CubicO group peptidase (beta-lactamase class C family)
MLQGQVQNHLDKLVDNGSETGLQVAVYRHGELIVDAVAGVADPETGRQVTADTPFFSFSTGKNMSSTIAHLLVARGLITYDSRIVEIWPEFGAHDKTTATIRHVLTHTVGVPAMPTEITPDDLPDWRRVCESLAASVPRWRPGTATGYHSYTFGYLVGEIARRVTGRSMGDLLRDLIGEPLGISDQLYFGVSDDMLPRLARLEDETAWAAEPAGSTSILAPWERQPRADLGNNRDFLRADIPSVGTATAHGLAAMYNAMLDPGRQLVTPVQLRQLSAVAFEGDDQVFGNPARLALGYPIGRIGALPAEHSTAFGWPGGGGSYAYADPATGVAFALTKNRLTPHFAAAQSVADLVTAYVSRSH